MFIPEDGVCGLDCATITYFCWFCPGVLINWPLLGAPLPTITDLGVPGGWGDERLADRLEFPEDCIFLFK